MPVSEEAKQRALALYAAHHETVLQSESVNWLEEWRQVAELTLGVSYHDPIDLKVLDLIGDCDRAYHYKDPVTFRQVVHQLRAMREAQWAPERAQIKAWMQGQGL